MVETEDVPIDPAVAKSEFCAQVASRSLRVTCYGSSSEKTPEKYIQEARSLGYILAKRGHVCVNGAGSFGCMSAMNDGALAGNGHIVGVIHEMFLVDGGFWGGKTVDRDGGAHRAFQNLNSKGNNETGPIREILVAGGDDLQQRKKLLVDKTEALIVLPGGPGTWDELWEMACARHLGLTKLPIVCVNVDNYYAPFMDMLNRAYEDKLIKKKPSEIVHFAATAEEAVRWIETTNQDTQTKKKEVLRRSSTWKRTSFFSPPPGRDTTMSNSFEVTPHMKLGLAFALGTAVGFAISFTRR